MKFDCSPVTVVEERLRHDIERRVRLGRHTSHRDAKQLRICTDGKVICGKLCTYTDVGVPLLSIENAMPIRDDLQEAMSYVIARGVASNAYRDLRDESPRTEESRT